MSFFFASNAKIHSTTALTTSTYFFGFQVLNKLQIIEFENIQAILAWTVEHKLVVLYHFK